MAAELPPGDIAAVPGPARACACAVVTGDAAV